MEKIDIKTTHRAELVDITAKIQAIVARAKVGSGACLIFCPHTTAGLTINENADPSVKSDMINTLNGLIPENAGYAHNEGNSDSHIKSSLFGSSLTIFVEENKLCLGTWQGIYFCESDGPRSRQAWVKVLKD
ncbi:MAG: secondary thiamine-phosphate synthase enzyme YjbQ [Candidatus Omnitrophica bacterium]|nr:secondary thiamine-phosphate synthase enzyme YjbQ [Candidatus Omnitrophota bacterium]MDD5611091.1 secondary thiamine-phosphate synthase enzyme YjbQ [Candidatus Omnitrophota bacterium]